MSELTPNESAAKEALHQAAAEDDRARLHEILPQSDRAHALAALASAPVMAVGDAAEFLGLPVSTIFQLRLRGEGPRMFRLGRRLYISQQAMREWLARMEKEEAEKAPT